VHSRECPVFARSFLDLWRWPGRKLPALAPCKSRRMDPYRVWTSLVGKWTRTRSGREGGVVLIAQLLGLLLKFIGEAMTSRLVISEALPPFRSIPGNGIRTGFEVILNEVDQLKGVSARLEALAEQHEPFTEALMTVAGNIRSTATVLGVLVAVRSPRPN